LAGLKSPDAEGFATVDVNGVSNERKEVLSGAFFWLTAFYFVYCSRPGELVPELTVIPLAKVSGGLAALSLLFSIGRTPRNIGDLPKEAFYLLLLIMLLFASALLSPVWKGGAFATALDFSKVFVGFILMFLLVTTLRRFRRIVFIQSASVAVVSCVALVKGHSVPRLEDVIPGSLYSNPNDMGFAIVLSIPFCLAFLLTARSFVRKTAWAIGIVAMLAALMLTASRAGFIDLVIAGTVLLREFGVKGKRTYLVGGAAFLCLVLLMVVGKDLTVRFNGIANSGNSMEQDSAHASYEERRLLMIKSVDAMVHYPLLGVGPGDFQIYSGFWRDVHASYLQIAVEGGIPVLILYLLFFVRGFANLRALGAIKNLDGETVLFFGALKSSLIGFVVGACFAPEAYQLYPYFVVCYTSVLLAMTKERQAAQVRATGLLTSPLGYPARSF
jgi:hypothetical protein